ncbi:MAG: isochorismate synthase [Rhodoglobus sp.]
MSQTYPRTHVNVTTRRQAVEGDLLEWMSATHPLAFVRNGEGIVGIGELLRLEFHGPERFTAAATAWAEICRTAVVHDSVNEPGTGLVAFGSFAFADDSDAVSVLIVPQTIVGSRNCTHWITTLTSAETGATADAGDQAETGDQRDLVSLAPRAPLGSPVHTQFVPGQMSEERFVATVEAALADIADGAAVKVVIARDQVAALPNDGDLRVALTNLAARYRDTFTFAVDGLIGSSPETLVRVQNGLVSARVLAGSAARGNDDDSDRDAAAALTGSAKDQREHALALASVLDALRPLSSTLAAADTPFTLRLPNLWHLATDIAGSLAQQSSSLDLLHILHPTAAVAGTPTAAAISIIGTRERFDRGRYAGPVGWVDADGNGEWAVALRCAQVAGGRITAYAGAGIVAGSDATRELAETELKFQPIIDAFS